MRVRMKGNGEEEVSEGESEWTGRAINQSSTTHFTLLRYPFPLTHSLTHSFTLLGKKGKQIDEMKSKTWDKSKILLKHEMKWTG